MDLTLESRIRDRAYAIWEAEGHPHGEDLRHWEMARRELVSAEPAPKAARSGTRKASATPKEKPVTAPSKSAATKATGAASAKVKPSEAGSTKPAATSRAKARKPVEA